MVGEIGVLRMTGHSIRLFPRKEQITNISSDCTPRTHVHMKDDCGVAVMGSVFSIFYIFIMQVIDGCAGLTTNDQHLHN